MSLRSKIIGTIETIFQIGLNGPQVKANAGNIEARDSGDAAFVLVRGATPVGANDLTTKAYSDLAAVAFRGTYYVDPTFAGATSTGSAAKPFVSHTAAFAFAAGAGITSGILIQAPGTTSVESVTFPTTGEWEIATQPGQDELTTGITGNVDISATAGARRALTNIKVTGNITGNCSAGTQRVLLTATQITGTITLTQTGGGLQRLATRGGTSAVAAGGNIAACLLVGAVAVSGTFWGSDAIFSTSLSVTATSSFSFCDTPPTTSSSSAGTVDLFMTNCSNAVAGALAFTATSGTMRLKPDFSTLEELQRLGTTLTGTVSIKALIGASAVGLQTNNVASTPLSGILPAGMMVAEACLTLVANGGLTIGLAVLNVIYTDSTGALVTEPVTTALNVAGAVGSKARGTLPFSQNAATGVNFSITGITNATGLSFEADVAVRQAS